MKHARRVIAVAVPAILYAASMFMPVATIVVLSNDPPTLFGYEAFSACFRCFYLDGGWDWERIGFASAWMANPALWCAIVFIAVRRRLLAISCAGVGCVLALGAFCDGAWFIDLPGYWFWLGSIVAALLSAYFLLKQSSPAYADDYGPLKIERRS